MEEQKKNIWRCPATLYELRTLVFGGTHGLDGPEGPGMVTSTQGQVLFLLLTWYPHPPGCHRRAIAVNLPPPLLFPDHYIAFLFCIFAQINGIMMSVCRRE